jgi:hypothetical protein
VDLIVTPEEVIHCARTPQGRPQGIIWSHLKEETIAQVPVLTSAARRRS